MLLSSQHRFLFIHIPKTAGTSITEALEPLCDVVPFTPKTAVLRGLPLRGQPDTAWFQTHDTAAFVRRKLGAEVYAGFTSFCVVRNPYDHARSHYEFLQGYKHRAIARKVRAMGFLDYLNWRLDAPPRWRLSRTGFFARFADQSGFVTDAGGALIVDRVLRFERLAADLADLAGEIGFAMPPLTHRRKSDRRGDPPFSGAEQDAIARLYARDFANFGYRREPPGGLG